MRLAIVALVFVTACSPEIDSGAYFCGVDSVCPSGQACNGSDNACVLASSAQPFACPDMSEHEPDDTPAEAFPLASGLTCASVQPISGCLHAGDVADWFAFTSPSGCASLSIKTTLEFPTAFEESQLTLAMADGTPIATDQSCAATQPGNDAHCLKQTIATGTAFALSVTPTGNGACDGACDYNRYTLTISFGP